MVNRVSSYFPKGGHSATQTEIKINMNTRKVKRHRNSDTKKQATENHKKTTASERSVMNKNVEVRWFAICVSRALVAQYFGNVIFRMRPMRPIYLVQRIIPDINEPRCEKTGIQGFRAGLTQTWLCSHRRWLES